MATPTRQRYKLCLSLLASCLFLPIASSISWAQDLALPNSAKVSLPAKSLTVKSLAAEQAAEASTDKPTTVSEVATPEEATPSLTVTTAETVSLAAPAQPVAEAQVKPLFSQSGINRSKSDTKLTKAEPAYTTQSAAAQPVAAQPVAAQPVAAQPVAAQPATVQPTLLPAASSVETVALQPVVRPSVSNLDESRGEVQLSAAPLLEPQHSVSATNLDGSLPETREQQLAQNTNPALSDLLIPALPQSTVTSTGRIGAPASSISTPIAFGARGGQAYTSVGYQAQTRGVPGPNTSGRADGGVGFGFGIGDPTESVALEVGITSVSTLRRGLFEGGTVSFKVHHMLENDMAVALGVENLVTWGVNDGGTSVYGVITKHFQLSDTPTAMFSSVTVSAGVGGGRFRPIDDIRSGTDSINLFGSVGIRVAEPVSFIADWSGQDLGLGLSIAPFRNIPLTITPAIVDITGNSNSDARFVLGVGYGVNF
jgi:hypothetical protein